MNTVNIRYAILYNFTYMAIGALTPLIGQYLTWIGFSGTQVGCITATGTAVAIVASTFWGGVYSSSQKRYRLIMIIMLAAAAMNFMLSSVTGFITVLAIFGIMYFFQAPVMSLTDAFTVENGCNFGGLRTWGAVGFALGVFITARAVNVFSLRSIFPIYIGSYIIAAIAIYMIHRSESSLNDLRDAKARATTRKTGKGFRGYFDVLHDKRLLCFIICTFFMGGTNVANNTYFSFLYIEGGGSLAGVGICMLIMVGMEAPFMAWSRRLSDRFSIEKMIFVAMIVSVLRFGAYGMGLPWWLLMIVGVSQGFVNGILLVEFVRMAAKLAPAGCESLAISTYYIIGSNLSTIVCQFIGGIILDCFGATGVYLFFSGFNAIGVILFLIFGLYKTKKYE